MACSLPFDYVKTQIHKMWHVPGNFYYVKKVSKFVLSRAIGGLTGGEGSCDCSHGGRTTVTSHVEDKEEIFASELKLNWKESERENLIGKHFDRHYLDLGALGLHALLIKEGDHQPIDKYIKTAPSQQNQQSFSTFMLSLCTPVTMANTIASDPAKAIAAATTNLKAGAAQQGIMHAAQYSAAQSTNVGFQLLPGGFPRYVHNPLLQFRSNRIYVLMLSNLIVYFYQ
ncbi:hypothetical protein CTI12_AA359040 [Artemisia annua]|uniref:Uncharacterized protein n=1 Tax=Artemisia annua TaxID=35608 RepID=A0A2U1MH19_ARTAN|nr:hypothetical protein CTI12_AA359040 [Artemisia annua]